MLASIPHPHICPAPSHLSRTLASIPHLGIYSVRLRLPRTLGSTLHPGDYAVLSPLSCCTCLRMKVLQKTFRRTGPRPTRLRKSKLRNQSLSFGSFLQPAATNQGLCNVYVFLFFDNLDGFCVTAHDLARHIFLYEARATICIHNVGRKRATNALRPDAYTRNHCMLERK